MTLNEVLKLNNDKRFDVQYTYNGSSFTILTSDYVKMRLKRKYGLMYIFSENEIEFYNAWVEYKTNWLLQYNNFLNTLFNRLYSLEGETKEVYKGEHTNTKVIDTKDSTNTDITNTTTNNLKNSVNTNNTNVVTNNTKVATNTDIKNGVTNDSTATHFESSADDSTLIATSKDVQSSNAATNYNETVGNKSSNYTENSGSITTLNNGSKADNYTEYSGTVELKNVGSKNLNYTENVGTIEDIETWNDYEHIITNTETDYLVYAKFLEEFNKYVSLFNELIDGFVDFECWYSE